MRFFASLIVGAGLFVGAIWYFNIPTAGTDDPTNPNPVVPPVDPGGPLFPPAELPKVAAIPPANRVTNPLAFLGHMAVIDKIELGTEVPGQLLFIGEELAEGAAQVAGVAPFLVEPMSYREIDLGKNRKHTKFFRRLYQGNIVQDNQMVAMVNPTRVMGELYQKQAKVVVSEKELKAAKALAIEGERRYARALSLYPKAISLEDLGIAEVTKEKQQAEWETRIVGVELARIDEAQVHLFLKQHEVRNALQFKSSTINAIYRNAGEPVKEHEPVMQLFSLDRLMAEALVDVQYMHRIKGDMRVTIEPSQETGEIWKFPNHVAPITAVAVTKDANEPLIISASEDKTVCVWQRFARQPLQEFVHPAPVRALAVTGRGAARNLILSGCSDGSIRLYDLDAPEKKLVKDLKDAHREAITALAFSPDGKFFASGAADGSIRIWDAEASKNLYEFDSAAGVDNPHQGMITALAITPQARLVSAARDNSLRVWALKEKGAVLEIERSGRSGNVPQLGVSQDGRWMLFDHGKILQIRAVDDGKLVTTLQNPGGAIPFETLAVFSPDASLMLTAGAAQGRLQMWRAPNETERGYEIRQLVPPEGAAVTCAAFSPWAGLSPDASFAVSGTKEGLVYMWPVPTKEEVHNHPIRDVRVKVIQAGQDPSTRQVRIGVEVPNPVTAMYPKGRLIPGRPVTIVIE
ncbi:MAG: hypothetical protein L0215_23010 [Gemmataceae bacterium]|nr:hypothetical protein [Gemmataceae bacterium]